MLLAAVLWGTLGAAAKPALDTGASGFVLALGRASLVGMVYLFYRRSILLSWNMLVLSLLGVAPMYVSYMYSVEYNGVGTASVLLYTAPLWTIILFAPLVLGERPHVIEVVLGALSVAGVYVLYGAGYASPIGILVGLVSGLSYSVVIVMSRKMVVNGYSMLDVALAPITLATPVILASMMVSHEESIGDPYTTLLSSVYMGISTGVAYLAYVKGLKYVEAAIASVIATIEPLTAILLDVFAYHASYNVNQITGSIMILASVSSIMVCKRLNPAIS